MPKRAPRSVRFVNEGTNQARCDSLLLDNGLLLQLRIPRFQPRRRAQLRRRRPLGMHTDPPAAGNQRSGGAGGRSNIMSRLRYRPGWREQQGCSRARTRTWPPDGCRRHISLLLPFTDSHPVPGHNGCQWARSDEMGARPSSYPYAWASPWNIRRPAPILVTDGLREVDGDPTSRNPRRQGRMGWLGDEAGTADHGHADNPLPKNRGAGRATNDGFSDHPPHHRRSTHRP